MKRINNSFTAEVEDKILWKIVPLVPKWMSPDFLTFSSLFSAFLIGIFYIESFHYTIYLLGANICLCINWIADSTDGKVAEYRGNSRPNYGYYIDHMLDSVSVVFMLGGLALSHLSQTSIFFFVGFIMLLCYINALLKTPLFKTFFLSLGRVGPTDGRLLLFFVNVFVLIMGNYTFSFFEVKLTMVDVIGFIFISGISVVLIRDVYKTARILDVQDRLKWTRK